MKIGIIGAGHVGETAAYAMAKKELGDIVLLDVVEDMPQGKALDMMEAACIYGWDSKVIGTNDYADLSGASIVVVTAGVPRKPGMSRTDLLQTNSNIVKNVTEQIVKHAPNSIIIVVSNPLDIMTYLAMITSNLPKSKVFGMAGVLDSARFRAFISMELDASIADTQAMVLGGHGDQMVPLPRFSTVSGVPITELMDAGTIQRLVDRTKVGGGEIVKLLKSGSAYYAPAESIVQMVESIVLNKKRILPTCAFLEGQYGIENVYLGVPCKLGTNGIEEIIELKLSSDESDLLKKSANIVQDNIIELENILKEMS
jgi:malate dehydrogenase